MQIDILIFAVIAAFLIYRLNSVLGTRHGDERERPNPFAPRAEKKQQQPLVPSSAPAAPRSAATAVPLIPPARMGEIVDAEANKDGRIEDGLAEIAAADPHFSVDEFMKGARHAFEMIVKAYAAGDLGALKPLLSPGLYKDFAAGVKAREDARRAAEVVIHRIKTARIVEAHLGGAMAYVTVDFDVEETAVTRDEGGNVVEGDPDRISSIEDIWTFTRDIRTDDPNWTLIETRAVEKV